jgi:predicted membrane protein
MERRIPPPATTARTSELGSGTGHVLLGTFLVLLGGVWLVEATTDLDIPTSAIFAVLLIVLGLLVLTGRARAATTARIYTTPSEQTRHATTSGPSASLSPTLGIGERTLRPTTLDELVDGAGLTIGQVQLDLTGCAAPARDLVREVSVGTGELRVRIPRDYPVRVEARVDLGELRLYDEQWGGAVGSRVAEAPTTDSVATLTLRVRVGLGALRVEHA